MREKDVGRLCVVENDVCLGTVRHIDLALHGERARLETEQRMLEEERRKLGAISESDDMYVHGQHDHYYRVGLEAVDRIKHVIRLAGKSAPESILDLPSGYG